MALYNTLASVIPKRLHVPAYLHQYTRGVTPLSTGREVAIAMAIYFTVVFSGREFMRKQPAFKMKALFRAHNIFLSIGSGFLLLMMLEELLPMLWQHGLWYTICSPHAFTTRLRFFYLINYYTKYYELLDTVFLVLKKKPLAFLHVFHHSATAVLCWTELEGENSVQWIVISINLLVHTIMYYYYYATAGGRRFWWKKYLTSMQITQFMIDIAAIYTTSYAQFAHRVLPNSLPQLGECAGAGGSAALGCALITSYLGLFINFYIKTYRSTAAARGTKGGKASAVAEKPAEFDMGSGNISDVGEKSP